MDEKHVGSTSLYQYPEIADVECHYCNKSLAQFPWTAHFCNDQTEGAYPIEATSTVSIDPISRRARYAVLPCDELSCICTYGGKYKLCIQKNRLLENVQRYFIV